MPRAHPDPDALCERLATLSDTGRLRMLRLLEQEELSVGELARSLQFPQSTVSRHLKLLHNGQWIVKRAEGTASLYRLDVQSLDDDARELWSVASKQFRHLPTIRDDDVRLQQVLASRATDSKAFFGRIGGEWDELRRTLFGSNFTAKALLGLLDPNWIVADLGCGTGNAVDLLAPFVRNIIAVDREPAMLDAARKRVADKSNVEFRQGDLLELPMRDHEVDAAVVLLVMHHIAHPAKAVTEIARTLKPGGVLLIVDMVAHDRDSYRHTMGHEHLGFDEKTVHHWCSDSDLTFGRYSRLRTDTTGKGPGLFAATLVKP